MTYKARTTAYECRNREDTERFYETAEFKKLEKVWYSKLKETGFDDIEDTQNARGVTYDVINKPLAVTQESVFEYYRMVGIYAHNAAFETETAASIMLAHSDGMPIRDIAAKLNGYKKSSVHNEILKHKKVMLNGAGTSHVIDKACVSRDAIWILTVATKKNLERFMNISSLFDAAEIKPAAPTEQKGRDYE